MSRFFVGQRVKLVRSFDGISPSSIDAEGFIHKFVFLPEGYVFPDGQVNPSDCDCQVYWIGLSGLYAQHTSQLEPVLPSGERASDYSLSELLDRCKQGEGVPA